MAVVAVAVVAVVADDVPGRARTGPACLLLARAAMRRVLAPEERATARAEVVAPGPGWPADPADLRVLTADERIEPGERRLRVTVLGEETSVWLPTGPDDVDEDDAEVLDRIVSDLQDFVAESAFGWGQRRG